jgi:hypothetical protein
VCLPFDMQPDFLPWMVKSLFTCAFYSADPLSAFVFLELSLSKTKCVLPLCHLALVMSKFSSTAYPVLIIWMSLNNLDKMFIFFFSQSFFFSSQFPMIER